MQVFEKNTADIMDKRKKLTEHQCLTQSGIPGNRVKEKFEIYLHKIRYNVKLIKELSIFETMVLAYKFIKFCGMNNQIELIGLQDSTHDYNQTIHLTLDTRDLNSFWSSKGSNSADSSEWLLYQTKNDPCLISSVMITAFQARFHYEDPIYTLIKYLIDNYKFSIISICILLYYPNKLRILVGFSETNFHYISPLFNFEPNACDQYFWTFPDIVIGNYLKIEFYGKPTQQDTDDKYYIALQKVCAYGCPISEQITSDLVPDGIKPTLLTITKNLITMSELESEEAKEKDKISEEAFTFVESSLISLITGETTLLRFMQDNNINDFFEWIEPFRIVLAKSDILYSHLDNPVELREGRTFIKGKNLINLNTDRFSLCKLILCYLYQRNSRFGILDIIDTEIYFRAMLKCNSYENLSYYKRVRIEFIIKEVNNI